MGILIRLSLRNLFRQKRRNLLLGAAIAVGMAVLVMANAFSHGISDVMFNRILKFASGNVSLSFTQGGNRLAPLFRDGDRMREIVGKSVPNLVSVEEAIGIFARAVGNGRTDNAVLVGMDLDGSADPARRADLAENFRMIEGDYANLGRADLENPVLLAEDKAKTLNVRMFDVLRVRFQDVNGQNQAARLTVAGIFSPANVFMNMPVFLDVRNARRLAGYGPRDIGQLYLMVRDPKKNAVPAADALHAALRPPLAVALGRAAWNGRSAAASVLGFRVDSASLAGFARALPGISASDSLTSKDVLVGRALADSLGLRPGDRLTFAYASKWGDSASASFTVTRVLPASPSTPGNAVWVNDRDFYAFYYDPWPAPPRASSTAFVPDSASSLRGFLCREWVLLDRPHTTQELQRTYKLLPRLKTHAVAITVPTMYESASMILNLEYALNLITLAAVLVLFFIIQVGVVNTLRMTIRERTREIGTLRALGMQRPDVRNLFLLEAFFLALFACVAGVALAFVGMAVLGHVPIHAEGNHWDMLLVQGHLHFKPNLAGTLFYGAVILVIAAVTAWFPARTASRLPPSKALGHFG